MASSRIPLTPLNAADHPDREIYVGWDRGMQTYYAQVFDGEDANGNEVLLVDRGNSIGDLTYPGGVIDAVRDYAEIPADLATRLADDRAADTSTFAQLRTEAGHVARQALQGDPTAIDAILGTSAPSVDDVDLILGPHTVHRDGTDTAGADNATAPLGDDEDFGGDDGLHSGLGY
ncbi:hypothetical protein [Amycolatopsis anabasis]|uniref:hypothetical protein n=1 Tax=Amycolatopsis anabasis TaxID=1840409 RepID=UPI00131E6360|nr:hypothetical protein [Amycolatopsis anabasis]